MKISSTRSWIVYGLQTKREAVDFALHAVLAGGRRSVRSGMR